MKSNEGLALVPLSLEEANAFVEQHHRHHGKVVGHKFSIGIENGSGRLVGVAIVGRPVSRMLDNGLTLEVTRCCSDGTKNVCSMLYRSAWRAALAMGYKRLVTYILKDETGTSVKAAGFRLVGKVAGGSWNRRQRLRIDNHPTQGKLRFELVENRA